MLYSIFIIPQNEQNRKVICKHEEYRKGIAGLKRLLVKICEDDASGKLNDERLDVLN